MSDIDEIDDQDVGRADNAAEPSNSTLLLDGGSAVVSVDSEQILSDFSLKPSPFVPDSNPPSQLTLADASEDPNAQTMGDQQGEMPFAMVSGSPVTEVPKDLYIPPSALQVILEAFEGPLDLLLYLIRRQNIDILEINVASITEQYMHYVDLMDAMEFELAAEYLLMAAVLAEIKSRMLLPRQSAEDEDEDDPRAALIRRLQEYERFKTSSRRY